MLALTVPALADSPDYDAVVVATPTGFTTGVLSKIADRVEFEGRTQRLNLGRVAKRAPIGGTAWYAVSKAFDLGLAANLEEDVKGYGIAIRFHFGK